MNVNEYRVICHIKGCGYKNPQVDLRNAIMNADWHSMMNGHARNFVSVKHVMVPVGGSKWPLEPDWKWKKREKLSKAPFVEGEEKSKEAT